MAAWITSIVGVIALGILLEIVLPEGQTAKYVKGAFSLLVVFVIVAPLPNMLGRGWNFNIKDVGTLDGYAQSVYSDYMTLTEGAVEKYLAQNGYEVEVHVFATDDKPVKLKEVQVEVSNFKSEVYEDVSAQIKALMSSKYNVDKSKISVIFI